MSETITFAANQGEIGGGEVMLLALATAARDLGHDVRVVGPQAPGALVAAAREAGFTTTAVPADDTRSYLRGLRRWDRRERAGLLWCNGLRPAFATAGRRDRVVHLHQVPTGKLAHIARIARRGARATIVPSAFVAGLVPGSRALLNWTAGVALEPRRPTGERVTIGYLGRLSSDKGVRVLADAVHLLVREGHDVRLLLAGESRFVDADDAALVERSLDDLGQRVDRRGWMDRNDFFRAVDLAVFPSVAPESFGLVAAEAMAAGCPFVITDAGALPEVAGENYPYVARRGDAQHLADAIGRALNGDAGAQVEASRVRWERLFSPAAGHNRLAGLLADLLPTGVEHIARSAP